MPIKPGALLFDRVEQLIVSHDNNFQRISSSFFYFNRINRINHALAHYSAEMCQIRQKNSTGVLHCQLQI
jgi:hypothetical protein